MATVTGGVAPTAQFLAAGYSRTEIARLAAVVRQPRRGVFVLPECSPEHIWFEPERVLAEIRAVLGRRSQRTP